ncbi:MAG: hypothetical protein KGM42_04715 [Hyphomicrobiales bacterium]|nr:hypothetical protein [Hyphomicrobiales bacterium]
MTDATLAAEKPAQDVLRIVSSWQAAVCIVVVSLAQQSLAHFNGDNSWLITVADKVLHGAVAYSDIQESNPPLAFLLYMPAVVLSQAVGLRPEAWTVAEIFVCLVLALGLSARILRIGGALSDTERPLWRNTALFIFLFCPQFGFAEREHFAALFALPIVAAAVARAGGGRVELWAALLAGVGGGAALCLKPYYAAGVGAAALALVLQRRSLRYLFAPEYLTTATVFLAYLGLVQVFFPRFYEVMLPLGVEVYAPARHSLAEMLTMLPFLAHAALIGGLIFAGTRMGYGVRAPVLIAVAIGFLFTYVYQGKGWFNHAYPVTVFAMFATIALWRDRAQAPGAALFARYCVIPVFVCAPFFAAPAMALPGAEEYPGLIAAIRAHAPVHPKIAALAEELDVGHPAVRLVDGQWVGRRNAIWVNNCVNRILQTTQVDAAKRARLVNFAREDRRLLAEDVAAGRPDVILVESAALREWTTRTPELAHVLDGFEKAAQAQDIEVWVRSR